MTKRGNQQQKGATYNQKRSSTAKREQLMTKRISLQKKGAIYFLTAIIHFIKHYFYLYD